MLWFPAEARLHLPRRAGGSASCTAEDAGRAQHATRRALRGENELRGALRGIPELFPAVAEYISRYVPFVFSARDLR